MAKYLQGVKKKGSNVSVPADDMDDIEMPWDTPRSQGLVSRKQPGDEYQSKVDYDVEKASAEHMSDKGVQRGMTHGYKFEIDDARNKLGNPPRPPDQSETEYRKKMRSSYTGQRYTGTTGEKAYLEAVERRETALPYDPKEAKKFRDAMKSRRK